MHMKVTSISTARDSPRVSAMKSQRKPLWWHSRFLNGILWFFVSILKSIMRWLETYVRMHSKVSQVESHSSVISSNWRVANFPLPTRVFKLLFADLMTHKQFRFNLRAHMALADTLISVERLTFHSKIPRQNFCEIDHAKNQIKKELKFFWPSKLF